MRLALIIILACASHIAAGTVETLDGLRYSGDLEFSTNGGLRLGANIGEPVTFVPLTNVLAASFGPGGIDIADYSRLPDRWTGKDVGAVRSPGRSGMSNATVAIRVASGDIGGREDSFHYLAHPLIGDGEIVARIGSFHGGDLLAKAGVMIREDMKAEAPFAFAYASASGQFGFQFRAEQGGNAGKRISALAQPLPYWIKLRREQDLFAAFQSSDGSHWLEIGRTNLLFDEAPKIGLALASHGDLAVSTATFDSVWLTMNGLLGEYFGGPDLQQPKFTSIDPEVRFPWGIRPPDLRVGAGKFSVRWTGDVVPRYTEPYRFLLDADADLWVDEKPVPRGRFDDPSRADPVPLVAGRKHPIKLEYRQREGPANVNLGWVSLGQPLEVIPSARLWCSFGMEVPLPATNASRVASLFLGKGILLRDGSFLAGNIASLDPLSVRLSWNGHPNFNVPLQKVAAAVFRLPSRASRLEPGGRRTGVLLQNGDFVDGEIRPVDKQLLEVDSVLFGRKTFPLETGEVVAALCTSVVPEPFRYQFRTSDGSVLRALDVEVAASELKLQTTLLGSIRLPLTNVVELRGFPRQ